MKTKKMCTMLLVLMTFAVSFADEVTITSTQSGMSADLDLQAVAEIFKNSDTIENFEKAVNDPETGVNNVDLDEDGYVDYIRVLEEVEDDYHFIVLQVMLGQDQYQDVAVIEVEKNGDAYSMQVHGNERVYGGDYYVAPVSVHIQAWPILRWMFRPAYKPYHSIFCFGNTPAWWYRHRHVNLVIYQKRVGRFQHSKIFKVTHAPRLVHHHQAVYKPRTSIHVKKTVVVRKPAGKTLRSKTTITHIKRSQVKAGKTVSKRQPGGKTAAVLTKTVKVK